MDKNQKVKIVEVDNLNSTLNELVDQLDSYLDGLYPGVDRGIRDLSKTKCLLIYMDGVVAACGGWKKYADKVAEVAVIFTKPKFRRLGLAETMIVEIERIVKAQNYHTLVLYTGFKQTAAIKLYEKLGFKKMRQNYPPYQNLTSVVCMSKSTLLQLL